jgi:hypothetical protein
MVVPLAGLYSTSHDVSIIEPPGLLHNHPTKRPADVGATLSHTPAITLPSSFTHIAINISITKTPPNTPGPPAPEINILVSKAHHTSAQAKLVSTNPNVVAKTSSTPKEYFFFR